MPPHDKTNKMTVHPVKTQIGLGIRPVYQSSLCAQWVAKDPSFLHAESEDSVKTRQMPSLNCLHWAHMPFCCFCHEAAHITTDNVILYFRRLFPLLVFLHDVSGCWYNSHVYSASISCSKTETSHSRLQTLIHSKDTLYRLFPLQVLLHGSSRNIKKKFFRRFRRQHSLRTSKQFWKSEDGLFYCTCKLEQR